MSKPRLTDDDFCQAARELGVSVAHVKAVAEVESRGSGFLPSGEPVILFERHIFHRLTGGKFSRQHPDISNPSPGGYGASSRQHQRLQKAVALDREAALQSASWGLFQVMGFNWKLVGYKDLQEFINAAYRSEGDHLDMLVGYIQATGLDKALRNNDWHAFARGYNGPGYMRNRYHEKLAAAYKKHGGR